MPGEWDPERPPPCCTAAYVKTHGKISVCPDHTANFLGYLVEIGMLYEYLDEDGQFIYAEPWAGPEAWCTEEEWRWLLNELDKEEA